LIIRNTRKIVIIYSRYREVEVSEDEAGDESQVLPLAENGHRKGGSVNWHFGIRGIGLIVLYVQLALNGMTQWTGQPPVLAVSTTAERATNSDLN
jgi:hypothetical protein